MRDRDLINIIACTFMLQSISLFLLVNSGSTYSYIVTDLAGELGILVKILRLGMTVMSSLGENIIVDRVYLRCPLMVQGHVFPVDLMDLSFHGFNVIIGMDWLVTPKTRYRHQLQSRGLFDDHS